MSPLLPPSWGVGVPRRTPFSCEFLKAQNGVGWGGGGGGSAADALPRLSSSNAQNYRRFGSGPEQVLKLLQGRGPLLWL